MCQHEQQSQTKGSYPGILDIGHVVGLVANTQWARPALNSLIMFVSAAHNYSKETEFELFVCLISILAQFPRLLTRPMTLGGKADQHSSTDQNKSFNLIPNT